METRQRELVRFFHRRALDDLLGVLEYRHGSAEVLYAKEDEQATSLSAFLESTLFKGTHEATSSNSAKSEPSVETAIFYMDDSLIVHIPMTESKGVVARFNKCVAPDPGRFAKQCKSIYLQRSTA